VSERVFEKAVLPNGLVVCFVNTRERRRTSRIAGKALDEAVSLRRRDAARILHGKEGVGGSSPPEGFAKALHVGAFSS
jgi:hypothetical protein